MSSSAVKLHDWCSSLKCKCQKQISLTPRQNMLEGKGYKNKLQKLFRGTRTAWNKFIKPGHQIAALLLSEAVAAETKIPQVAQTTSNILNSISGGKILNLTEMHGHELRLKVV